MKKIQLISLLLLAALAGKAQTDGTRFIDELMAKMTLDEKIGQLNLMSAYDFVSAKTVNAKDQNTYQPRTGWSVLWFERY